MYNTLKSLFIFLLVAILLSNTVGGKLPKQLSRIAYGENASIDEHPYMASILVDYSGQICSASLISSTCVLTAAHCLFDSGTYKRIPDENLIVRAGSITIKEGGSTQTLASSSIPEKFDILKNDMDIAVIKLNGTLKGENIKPIEVNTEDISLSFLEKTITVAGWGDTETLVKGPRILKKAYIKSIVSMGNQFLANRYELSSDGLKIKNVCSGDSGGPAIYNGKQIGITSAGQKTTCGSAIIPGIFTRLGSKEVSTFLKKAIESLEC